MGWSCMASATLNAMQDACRKATGSQNMLLPNGAFFESSHTEHCDGAITGSLWAPNGRTTSDGNALYSKAGSWRIDGDGRLSRAPAAMRALLPNGPPPCRIVETPMQEANPDGTLGPERTRPFCETHQSFPHPRATGKCFTAQESLDRKSGNPHLRGL